MTTESESEPLNSIWRMYEHIRAYDLHYSTLRTTVTTILVTTSVTAGGVLLANKLYFAALFFPTLLLFISILLSNYFLYLTDYCSEKADTLEKLINELTIKMGNISSIKEKFDIDGGFNFRIGLREKKTGYSLLEGLPQSLTSEPGTKSLTAITVLYLIFAFVLFLGRDPPNVATPCQVAKTTPVGNPNAKPACVL